MELSEDELNQYAYLKRQHYLATHMELTEENVVRVLEELLPYIEADGGSLQLVEIEEETGYVKVRLGGACESCAMSTMTLKQGIEKKLMMEIPDVVGVVQVL
jgi:Fe-S cluster biogenesis protein NfuA